MNELLADRESRRPRPALLRAIYVVVALLAVGATVLAVTHAGTTASGRPAAVPPAGSGGANPQ